MGRIFFILIVALGIGMAIPATRAKMTEAAAPYMNKVKAKIVPARLDAMADQLAARVGRGEKFPNNWPGWLERDYSSSPQDPWGNLYYLEIGRNDFTVGSMGPDGKQNTPDDIKLRRRLK